LLATDLHTDGKYLHTDGKSTQQSQMNEVITNDDSLKSTFVWPNQRLAKQQATCCEQCLLQKTFEWNGKEKQACQKSNQQKKIIKHGYTSQCIPVAHTDN